MTPYIKKTLLYYSSIYFYKSVGTSVALLSMLSVASGLRDDIVIIDINNIAIYASVVSILLTVELGRIYYRYNSLCEQSVTFRSERAPLYIHLMLVFVSAILCILLSLSPLIIFYGILIGIVLTLINFIYAELTFKRASLKPFFLLFNVLLYIGFLLAAVLVISFGELNFGVPLLFIFNIIVIFRSRNYLARFCSALIDAPAFSFTLVAFKKFSLFLLVAVALLFVILMPRLILNNSGFHYLASIQGILLFFFGGIEATFLGRSLNLYINSASRQSSFFSITRSEFFIIMVIPILSTAALIIIGELFMSVDFYIIPYLFIFEFCRCAAVVSVNGFGIASSRSRLFSLVTAVIVVAACSLFISLG